MTIQKIVEYAGHANIINNNIEKRLFYTFSSIFVISLLSYGVFLSSIVFNIVARKNIENESRLLSSKIGQLELEYLSLSGKVDMQLAQSLGFNEVIKTNSHFASRKVTTKSVALTNNE